MGTLESTVTTTASVRLKLSPRLRLTLLSTPLASTPLLSPPTLTVWLPPPPLAAWFAPSSLMSPPLLSTLDTTLVSTLDSPPSTATTTASVRLRPSPRPTPSARSMPAFPLSTPTPLATPTTSATPPTTTDKSPEDGKPKPIGPNVAPWWRKPAVLLNCVTCAMNQING